MKELSKDDLAFLVLEFLKENGLVYHFQMFAESMGYSPEDVGIKNNKGELRN